MALQSENMINCMRTDGYFTTNATKSIPSPVNTNPATNNIMHTLHSTAITQTSTSGFRSVHTECNIRFRSVHTECNIRFRSVTYGPRTTIQPAGHFYLARELSHKCQNDRFVSIRCVFSSSKISQNSFSAGAEPGPRWGSLRCSPRLPSWLGRGHPLPIPFPLEAFGISISPPTSLKFVHSGQKGWTPLLYININMRGTLPSMLVNLLPLGLAFVVTVHVLPCCCLVQLFNM